MAPLQFIPANAIDNYDDLFALNLEYVGWVLSEIAAISGVSPEQVVGMPLREYIAGTMQKVCGDPPPRGVFYLLRVDGNLAGMCGLRCLRPGTVEIKRVYIRAGYRGRHLGEYVLERLLSDARVFGYDHAYLDTGPFMKAAQRLYEAHGFKDCPPYEGVEVPASFHQQWRFMERSLLMDDRSSG